MRSGGDRLRRCTGREIDYANRLTSNMGLSMLTRMDDIEEMQITE